jgi:hypothetical protein
MEEDLLPCPFELVEKEIGHNVYLDRELMQVTCSCGARGPIMAYTSAMAIKGWNTRSNGVANNVINRQANSFRVITMFDGHLAD